ncbi:hypothetical protein SH528x_003242 [Novipirellula sp. SH528]|uniref:alpha/beta hydrolase family protein n=1 Tax=Novipirellula sp. SH528 TaxID=3454466 RepID=UPI003F9F3231
MKTLTTIALIGAVLTASASAQQPPYDNAPVVEADSSYYRVRYEASTEPGELIFPVAYTLWVPPAVKQLRGVIVHQHGCGEGSCKSGQTGAFDLHWQSLAKKHDCALLSPAYEQPEGTDCQMWCDPRNGSDDAFQKSLVDLGDQSGHPELANVPWALWGHSGGGHWAGGMLLLHPERIAAVWLRSGVPLFDEVEGRAIKPHTLSPAALKVPVMCNLGTKEGVTEKNGRFAGAWPANQAFFAKMRSEGALIGIAIDPRTSHECGNSRYLAIPWLDVCLAARLPNSSGASLRPMPTQAVWLAELNVDATKAMVAVPAAKYSGDLASSIWLPNEEIARAWSQFIIDTNVADSTPPPTPTNVVVKDRELTWDAEADLESGISHFIIERDGQLIATVPEKSKNPFGRPLFQGLQYSDTPSMPLVEMRYTVEASQPVTASQYRVRAVNTVGLVSGE